MVSGMLRAYGVYDLSGTGTVSAGSEYVSGGAGCWFRQSDGNNVVTSLAVAGGGFYNLIGSGRLWADTETIASSSTFRQSGGTNVVSTKLTVTLGGTYELNGPGLLWARDEQVGALVSGRFTQSDGNHQVSGTLTLGGNVGSGTYVLSGSGRLRAGTENLGYIGSGSFTQSGGWNAVVGDLYIGSQASSTYVISDGNLDVSRLFVGGVKPGTLSITSPSAWIAVSSGLFINGPGILSAVPGSAIHMIGATFGNGCRDANAVAGLSNLRLIYEHADASFDSFEVVGKDIGADANGFFNNFGLGTLQLGGDGGVGRVMLADVGQNQFGPATTEALYLQSLVVNPGSELVLNGIHLYVGGTLVSAGDGPLYGGGGIYDTIPEPCTFLILGLGGAAILKRRRRG